MARFSVGIDLGTTNSALAYVDDKSQEPRTFAIPQLIAAGELRPESLLPSFLYVPGPHDLPAGALNLPWNSAAKEAVGQFARNYGAKMPGRLVSSAKSWLCHPGVDRTAPLLPWGAGPEVERLSPLDVSAKYLRHLVEAWNSIPGRKPEEKLEELPVVLTVPASFDDTARTLTAEAASRAGLKRVTLLEEPQAAFYAWLAFHGNEESKHLRAGMRCLVVDVGGGTSDFSLIRVGEEKGELEFLRDAVGDHLLLGGDNMDLALARSVEAKLGAGKFDAAKFGGLVQACRTAKENLLAENPPERHPVTVVGKGRSVVGGTLSVDITPKDVAEVLFEGFFPETPYDAEPKRAARGGLQEMGLPYVADPAVTRHLAAFLKKQLPEGEAPDAILFNGGVFTPAVLRRRLVEVMRPWFSTGGKKWEPLVLTTPSLDHAVAWGAASYSRLKETGGKRIGGGIPRSYYLGIEGRFPNAPHEVSVVCVVPRRLQEGEEVLIPQPEFELALGEPVLFPLYTSTARAEDHAGDVLTIPRDKLLRLPPLHTVLRGGKRSGVKRVTVSLAAKCTEIGTLELHCVSRESNRWKLEFNVREVVGGDDTTPIDTSDRLLDLFPEEKVVAASALLEATFTRGEPTPTELPKGLESALELARTEWPTALCRRLWDPLAVVADKRGDSPALLSRWYNLAGFCLRPGFGDPLDRYRVEALWKLISAGQSKGGTETGGADYWIMWRRTAGGLNTAIQQNLFAKLKPVLLPAKGKPTPRTTTNELVEMWRAAASFERLDTRTKQHLGEELLRQLDRDTVPNYLFWSLTRLGARRPLFGPLNSLLHPEVIRPWIDRLLKFEPTNDSEKLAWGFCLAQLGRKTGLRGADIGEDLRDKIVTRLREQSISPAWVKMVEEEVTDEADDRSRLFGDALPIGLKLAN